jgi:hypothetical protein
MEEIDEKSWLCGQTAALGFFWQSDELQRGGCRLVRQRRLIKN